MQRSEPPTFRPTFHLWAARPDALPKVDVFPVELDGAVINYIGVASDDWHQVELPDDFVLREVLDADPDAPTEFINQWGPLVPLDDSLRAFYPTPVRRQPAIAEASPWHVYEHGERFLVSTATSKLALHQLRALSKWWIAASESDEASMREAWTSEGFDDPLNPSIGALWWEDRVNAALRAFPMRIGVGLGNGRDHIMGSYSGTTYEVAVLQLALLAAGGRPLNRCANVNCGRAFTVQRTSRRAYKGTEHVTGVRYCSEQCAKAQSERDRRARRKAERQESGRG